jgi:hypothetical protein
LIKLRDTWISKAQFLDISLRVFPELACEPTTEKEVSTLNVSSPLQEAGSLGRTTVEGGGSQSTHVSSIFPDQMHLLLLPLPMSIRLHLLQSLNVDSPYSGNVLIFMRTFAHLNNEEVTNNSTGLC